MPIECRRSTTGGKGNRGLYIERDPNIVAAGLPTAQQDAKIGDSLEHYLLQEEVDALKGDSIIPPPKERPLPPMRKPKPLDRRFAGPFGYVTQLVNPPNKTKFQTLVTDFKDTAYKSFWHLPIGKVRDPIPMLPEGFDIGGTTFGKPTAFHGRFYDIVMPKVPYPDKTPPSKKAGYQIDRNYCAPPYDPDLTYGHRTFVDKRGTYARCCVTDDRVTLGLGKRTLMNTVQSNFLEMKQPRVGLAAAPNNNICEVPEGYAFGMLRPPGNIPECLTSCEINKDLDFFRECVKHLNTIRRGLIKKVLPTFFYRFYLTLKSFDTERTGWLPKKIVYEQCAIKFIRFDPKLMEPLLSMWKIYDGCNIEYCTFVRIINYREPSPEMPKVPDVKPECLDYRTTYSVMVEPGKPPDNTRMAGLPSGRYFDLDYPISPERCCRADRTCLPHESDMKSCIAPSVLTLHFVSHRDMYQKREPAVVKTIFERAGEKFSDERFNAIWEEAKKLHSEGWVCYETFRRAMEKYPDESAFEKENTENETSEN